MKICQKLFREINFEPASIQPCCDTRALQVPSFPYAGGPVDMRAYAGHIQKTADLIQQGAPVCKGCPELASFEGKFLDVTIEFKAVSINMHRFFCNCKCVYCELWKYPEKGFGYDVLPGLKSLVEQKALDPECFISWGGGEPGILPNFDKTSAWVQENGYLQYIHSNIIRFSPVIHELLVNDTGKLNVSLDSASRQIYRSVKGVDVFDKVIKNLDHYCANGGNKNITLKYIVFERNNSIGEISAFLDICQKLGIKTIQYSLNFQEINAGKVSEKTLLAAAFLLKKAKNLKLDCRPFFIDKPWYEKICKLSMQF